MSGVLPKESPDKSASTIFDTGKSPFVQKHPKFAGGDVSHRLTNIGGSPPIKVKHTPLSLSIIHQSNQQQTSNINFGVKKTSTISLSKSIENPVTRKGVLEASLEDDEYFGYELKRD